MNLDNSKKRIWYAEDACFHPNPNIKAEAIAVKDPSIVFYDGKMP